MGKVIGFLLLLIVLLFGLSFAMLNAQPITLDYYLGVTQMPLSLALVLALTLGAVLGVLASLGMLFRQRRELAKLRRKAGIKRKELNELRKLPLQDQP